MLSPLFQGTRMRKCMVLSLVNQFLVSNISRSNFLVLGVPRVYQVEDVLINAMNLWPE
jgi:hypothetical protein